MLLSIISCILLCGLSKLNPQPVIYKNPAWNLLPLYSKGCSCYWWSNDPTFIQEAKVSENYEPLPTINSAPKGNLYKNRFQPHGCKGKEVCLNRISRVQLLIHSSYTVTAEKLNSTTLNLWLKTNYIIFFEKYKKAFPKWRYLNLQRREHGHQRDKKISTRSTLLWHQYCMLNKIVVCCQSSQASRQENAMVSKWE